MELSKLISCRHCGNITKMEITGSVFDGTLASMLKELADKNEIPQKLVKIASGLKDFGNIGAHAGSGELTQKEIPIVNALCIAILEYIYSAPYLATIAEDKLNSIKNKAKGK